MTDQSAVLFETHGHILGFAFSFVLTFWKLFGFVGVTLFAGRWFVQMYYSQKAGVPVLPRAYWVMSIVGSLMLLIYWIFSPKQDMIGVLSNLFPFAVAAYNLYLDLRYQKATGNKAEDLYAEIQALQAEKAALVEALAAHGVTPPTPAPSEPAPARPAPTPVNAPVLAKSSVG
jgi:lipid-A-disaccharide synthase-like uncharacterized protein